MNKIRIESPEVQGFEKEHTAAGTIFTFDLLLSYMTTA